MHSASTLSTSDPTRNLPVSSARPSRPPRGSDDDRRRARLVEHNHDSDDDPPTKRLSW